MTLFFQQIVSGISIGAVYALLAVGYALIYSVYNFTNWAFDAFMVVGAFIGFYALASFHLPVWLAILLSIVLTAALAVLVETGAYRPLRMRNAPRLFMMISAMGANLAIVNLINLFFGGAFRKFPEITAGTFNIAGVSIGKMDLFAGVFSFVVLGALWFFLQRTKAGLAIRASSLDMTTAGIMGINNNTVALVIFGISGILSGVSGIFYGIKYAVFPYLGSVTIKAMIASIIGGLGSLPGAVVGSLLLGVLETLVSGYISSTYRDLFSFTLLIVILLFFPNGLMGQRTEEKL
ncbi:MAG: branched-chain amino acid ABC transporter permease [Anaerolineae bacterium]|nr:branched-chain amino acid ABC transporter permease [Anaerolineae bacterium]